MEANNTNILTVEDVSQILKIGRNKAYELFNIEGFPSFKVGKLLRISESDFKDWISKQAL
ncbi:MAG: helix-turn-helix domain-containing protein [Vulcanibacillus sp.]